MPAYVYFAAAGFVSSLFLFKWALSGNGARTSSAARKNLGVAKTVQRRPPHQRRFVAKLLDRVPIFGRAEQLQTRIAIAGLSWRSENVRFFRLVAVGGSLLLGALTGVATGSVRLPVVLIVGGVVLAALPGYVISAKAQERQQKLEEQLPDILDRLKITLEAGLGFDSALANVVHDRSGPGYDEFKRVLQDLQLGVPHDEALQSLSDRTTITDLRIVLAAVLQSGKYGLPLVEVLRVQTEELRDKRWQRAQERALKIPVKILFPLILCILPTFFVVLVGPSFISLLNGL